MIAAAHGAIGMEAWGKLFAGEVDLGELIKSVRDETDLVVDEGSQKSIEAMLMSQAMMLQTLATALIRKASFQDKLLQFQVNLNLGLKAQVQCRATLQTLAEIKNPRTAVAFVKQQNIASGHQQINNAVPGAEVQAGGFERAARAHGKF